MPGPGEWYDGEGDPFEAPKYLLAKQALERPGKSPEFVAALQDAVSAYEGMHRKITSAPDGSEPEPVEDEYQQDLTE